jgi:hypothetical protein
MNKNKKSFNYMKGFCYTVTNKFYFTCSTIALKASG